MIIYFALVQNLPKSPISIKQESIEVFSVAFTVFLSMNRASNPNEFLGSSCGPCMLFNQHGRSTQKHSRVP